MARRGGPYSKYVQGVWVLRLLPSPRGLVLCLTAWAAAGTTELLPVLFTAPVVLKHNVPNARLRLSGRECCPLQVNIQTRIIIRLKVRNPLCHAPPARKRPGFWKGQLSTLLLGRMLGEMQIRSGHALLVNPTVSILTNEVVSLYDVHETFERPLAMI